MENKINNTQSSHCIQQASLLRQAIDMPWIVINEARRIISIPFCYLFFFIHGIKWGKSWHIYGMPIIQRFRGSEIFIGDYAWLRSWKLSNPLIPNHPVTLSTRSKSAVISIGQHSHLTATIIIAMNRIEIGNHVWIGSNTTIVDTDFHPLDPHQRLIDPSIADTAPVTIEDDVFIGMNCIILKGVHIGKSSVVGAGSVVTKDVPPNAIVVGNPAVFVRNI
jgi:acetyltransferase-like isoleucine patch superfamily enzyme